MKVGFIGLGNMGRAMARNIARAGHELTVYNRTRSRAEELRQDGAHVADSPYDTALNADVVITMLANDEAVDEIVFGGGGTQGEGMRSATNQLDSRPSLVLRTCALLLRPPRIPLPLCRLRVSFGITFYRQSPVVEVISTGLGLQELLPKMRV